MNKQSLPFVNTKRKAYKGIIPTALSLILFGLLLLLFGVTSPQQESFPTSSPTPLVENMPESLSSAVASTESEQVLVNKVIDGDTIEIDNGIKVRLLGIDTPETKDTRKPVECFGKEAAAETKRLLEGNIVILEKDVSDKDKYKRLLRYIYLPLEEGQVVFVNDYLIREGFAKALNYPPDVKYNEQLREAEKFAKESKKGMWSRC